ncbi:MAG: protein kinase, partial [Proteobacteria bacterium]|nr:protein kinase [Pseudomonadota bacterium]
MVRQLLAGLGAAHDAGLVHADVKPANAIVVGDRVVLVDFGLARLRPTNDGAATSVGGTPAFMAPEQLAEGRVDARSDLFSAALVLVFLLTGWRRTTARALVPPDDVLAALPAALRTILAIALATDPAQRFQTAGDFAAALAGKAPVEHATITAPPRVPFHHLEPLTEHDQAVYGRERDLERLVDHALYGRSVLYTAPSG